MAEMITLDLVKSTDEEVVFREPGSKPLNPARVKVSIPDYKGPDLNECPGH